MDSTTDVASSRSHNSSWSSLLKVSRIRRPVVLKLAEFATALFGFRKPPTKAKANHCIEKHIHGPKDIVENIHI